LKIQLSLKLLITAILIFNLYQPEIYPQQEGGESVVTSYIRMIDSLNAIIEKNIAKPEYDRKVNPFKELVKKMKLSGLKHIASMMFRASDLGHIALMDTASERYLRTEKSRTTSQFNVNFGGTQSWIQNEIKELISPALYGLTRTAYFFKIRVEKEGTSIPTEEQMLKIPMITIDAVVDDVFKGRGEYSMGDKIQFYFYPGWLKGNMKFEIGKEYFVPLEPRGTGGKPPQIHNLTTLVVYLDDSNG